MKLKVNNPEVTYDLCGLSYGQLAVIYEVFNNLDDFTFEEDGAEYEVRTWEVYDALTEVAWDGYPEVVKALEKVFS